MTTGRGEGHAIAAGGPARHIPVLRDEVLAALAVQPGKLYLDATFGAGGYAEAILSIADTRLLALDRDPQAVAAGADGVARSRGRLTLLQARFGALAELAAARRLEPFDGIVFDIGVSSMQLDQASRGFSFRQDGPLDMRMEQGGRSAADIVNDADEETLADIFYYYGEDRLARRFARRIVAERAGRPFVSTLQLSELIARTAPHRDHDIHPATRVFQALRIAVNDELGELLRGLAGAERLLRGGGRLAVVTFHSLEDRLVKLFLAQRSGRGMSTSRLLPGELAVAASTFRCDAALFGKQPIVPGADEIRANPRARSAKLRAGQRTDAPPQDIDPKLAALAQLPRRNRQGKAHKATARR
jgi:16S rRNA (cytosine1402-N4)-methyltransferase